jgi:hypothetical protein
MSNTVLINDVEYMPVISVDNNGAPVKTASGELAVLMSVDGLSPTQSRISAATYNSSQVIAVQIISLGSGDLTLSPSNGATDIVLTAAELSAMGASAFLNTWYGPYDSITAGTGMELLAYTRLP